MNGWETVDPELRKIILRVCTPKQVEVMQHVAAGYGLKRSAQILGITKEAVRDLRDRAGLNIRQEVAAMRGLPEMT